MEQAQDTESQGTATINLEDGQIRFWPNDRLPKDLYLEVKKMRLTWSRGEQCFKGAWGPNKADYLAKRFGITELDDDETDLMERAESRSDHFQTWSDNANKRSDERHEASHQATAGIPFGQPILIGHHSEQRHRNAIKRSWDNLGKAVEESKRAEHWSYRAERAVKAQEYKQRPGVISRRIDKLEAQLRMNQRNADHDRWVAQGDREWAIHRGQDPDKVWQNTFEYAQRWIVYLTARIEYQKALLKASGGLLADPDVIAVGDYIKSWVGWAKVLRVNKKSVSVERPDYGWKQLIKYSDIKGHRKASEMEGQQEEEQETPAEPEPTPEPEQSHTEKIEQTAQEDPLMESTQAAQRVLAKREARQAAKSEAPALDDLRKRAREQYAGWPGEDRPEIESGPSTGNQLTLI